MLGRLLLRVARPSRRRASATPPADDDLTLPQPSAWDVYCVGRLGRLGYHVRSASGWLYHFRNRHGFTDAADAAFDRLWAADDLTWAEIVALSEGVDRERRRLSRGDMTTEIRHRQVRTRNGDRAALSTEAGGMARSSCSSSRLPRELRTRGGIRCAPIAEAGLST